MTFYSRCPNIINDIAKIFLSTERIELSIFTHSETKCNQLKFEIIPLLQNEKQSKCESKMQKNRFDLFF